jgi:RNase P subunit RPR2
MRLPRLTNARVHKLQRLLNLQHNITDIAKELGITTDTLYRSYIPAGMPCTKDERGHYWVNGKAFVDWASEYVTTRDRKPKKPMDLDQAYCMKCNQVVRMVNKRTSKANYSGIAKVTGRCQVCDGKVSRFIQANKEGEHDRPQ